MNTCVSPLSIITGMLTTIQRCGSLSLSRTSRSSPRRSATRSSWRTAIWYVSESISLRIDGTAIPSHPLFTHWIHASLSVELQLPLGLGPEVHQPALGLDKSLILLHKSAYSTAIVPGTSVC